MKVLVVEDSADVGLVTIEYLNELEHDAVLVPDAEQALALLPETTFDAVMTDIRLPGMDGLQLTRLIKLARGAKQVPIIAVSANNTPKSIQEAFESGCDGYITKPVDTRTFATDVHQYLDRE